MIKLLTLFLILISSINIKAQEKLVKLNGDTIFIELIDLNETYILFYNKVLEEKRISKVHVSKLSKLIYADGTELLLGPNNVIIIKNGKPTSVIKSAFPTFFSSRNIWGGIKVKSKEKSFKSAEVIKTYNSIGATESIIMFEKGRGQNLAGNVLGFFSGLILGNQFYYLFSTNKTNAPIFFGSVAASILSISLSVKGRKKINESINSYNNEVYLKYISSQNGIGLSIVF